MNFYNLEKFCSDYKSWKRLKKSIKLNIQGQKKNGKGKQNQKNQKNEKNNVHLSAKGDNKIDVMVDDLNGQLKSLTSEEQLKYDEHKTLRLLRIK